MAATISTTIDIDAGPDAVWAVLTDFPSYEEWNPFVTQIAGSPEVGTKLVVRISPPGGRGMTFRPTVLAATPGRELRWLGTLGVRGLFDGEHSFVLSRQADGSTRLVHGETFTGLLVALFGRSLKDTGTGFEAFNVALKGRVETSQPPR